MVNLIFLSFSLIISSFTVLFYDYLLSFADEVEFVWKRQKTPFSLLFLFNRYFTLSVMGLLIATCFRQPAPPTQFTMGSNPKVQHMAAFIYISPIAILSAEMMLLLRVYAVYNKNKITLGVLSSIWVIHLILVVIALREMSSFLSILLKDTRFSTIQGAFNFMVLRRSNAIMYILPAVVFDLVAGGLLTFILYRRSRSDYLMPLVKLIIQDGVLYFCAVFIVNASWLATHTYFYYFNFSAGVVSGLDFVPLEGLSASITTMMIGRLTLNLRKYDPSTITSELTFGDISEAISQSLRFERPRSDPTPVNRERVEGE